jgi:hypothetical protein
MRLILIIAFSCIMFTAAAQPDTHRRRHPPLKYLLHRKKTIAMVTFFDSISKGKYYAIGLTTDRDKIHIKTDYRGKNLTCEMDMTSAETRKYLDSAGIGFENVVKIKTFLEQAHMLAISNVMYGPVRMVEVTLNYNLLADNCKGLTFIEHEADEKELPFDQNYKKVGSRVFYSHYTGSPFYY